MNFARLIQRHVILLATGFILVVAGAGTALAVQTSALLSVSPSDWGLLDDGQEIDVTIRATNGSGDTPAHSFPADTNAPKASELAGPITVQLSCANSGCTSQIPGVLAFVPVGGNGCVSKNAGVSNCVSGGANVVTINFGSTINLPPLGTVDIATIRVKVLSKIIAAAVGIKATTATGAVTTCSTASPSTCVSCAAEGCTKVVFLEDMIHGCPHPCPSRIRFLKGVDSFEFHAEIEVSQAFDPGHQPVTVTLTNANWNGPNPVFSLTLPAGKLVLGTDSYRYTDSTAKDKGGFSVIKVGRRDGTTNSWKFDVVLYDANLEARATLSKMKVSINVGGDPFNIEADWKKMPYGWFFDIP